MIALEDLTAEQLRALLPDCGPCDQFAIREELRRRSRERFTDSDRPERWVASNHSELPDIEESLTHGG